MVQTDHNESVLSALKFVLNNQEIAHTFRVLQASHCMVENLSLLHGWLVLG